MIPGASKGPCQQGFVKSSSPDVIERMKAQQVAPIYPEAARSAHAGGTVVLHILIGRDGRVRSVSLVSAPRADLAASAIYAVRQWVYQPFYSGGGPVDIDGTIRVNFANR